MVSAPRLIFCLLFVSSWIVPAAAQSTGNEFRPELGFYVQQGPLVRLEFVDFFTNDLTTGDRQGNFAFYIRTALKPVFRRELRDQPDVYRNKYLTVLAGYRYRTGLTNSDSTSEHRGILEVTPRYLLPWQLVITDRNRGEFRFIKSQPFSTRYRNRLRLERDIEYHWLRCTPYIYDEIFYDQRYDQWTPNRYGLGVQFPAGPHVIVEPYYYRQNGSHSNPPHLNVFALTWSLYF